MDKRKRRLIAEIINLLATIETKGNQSTIRQIEGLVRELTK